MFLKRMICLILAISLLNLSYAGFCLPVSKITADEIDVFQFNEDEIYMQFDDLSELEALVATSDITYSELENEKWELIELVNNNNMIPVPISQDNEMKPPVMSGFLWGCLFGLMGVVVVYVSTDDDSLHRKKAMNGCIVGSIVGGVITAGVYGLYFYALSTGNIY